VRATGNNANSFSNGDVFDCISVGGSTGPGRMHIPIRLRGDAFVSWTVTGAYVPPESLDPAGSQLTILCATGIPDCVDPSFVFDVSQPIDTTVELVFQFNFGTPLYIQYGPRVSTGVGYAANGSAGFLDGTATLDVEGVLLPAYVTDLAGTVLPGATISATSGFDYLHPVPEPGAAAYALAAFATLLTLRRRVTTSR
jgi:hypothetical protein